MKRCKVLSLIIGLWICDFTQARWCRNTKQSDSLGNIQFKPTRYKPRKGSSANPERTTNCSWSLNPTSAKDNDFILTLKFTTADFYNAGDYIVLPEGSTLPKISARGDASNFCIKYAKSTDQSRSCLEEKALQFCPETNITSLDADFPLSLSISTRSTLGRGNYYHYTQLVLIYAFVFCPSETVKQVEGTTAPTTPPASQYTSSLGQLADFRLGTFSTKAEQHASSAPEENFEKSLSSLRRHYLASTIAAALLALFIIIAIAVWYFSRIWYKRRSRLNEKNGIVKKKTGAMTTNYLGANISLQLASANIYDNPAENISLYDQIESPEVDTSDKERITKNGSAFEPFESTHTNLEVPTSSTFKPFSTASSNGRQKPEKPNKPLFGSAAVSDDKNVYSVVKKT